MPANISGNSVSSLGCSFFSRPSFLGGRKEILQFSMGERVITFSVNQMNKIILNTVTRQSTKDISAWKSDERIVYPSRLINMGIDKHCSENNTNITGDVRQRVFTLIAEDFGIKLASLCEGMSRDDKNKTREILENKLADRFFEKHIDSKIDIKKLQDSVEGYIILAKAMSAK
ncbi:bfpT-regulated chaperone [Escherichia coli]